MKNNINIFRTTILMVFCLPILIFTVSCEEAFEFDLPEAGSLKDNSLPVADFAYRPNAENFRKIEFNNLSTESIKYVWDFGSGNTSEEKDPSYTFAAGEGVYPVTLTALDANEASSTITLDVEVVDRFVPLPVTVLNGDFNSGTADWKIESFPGGTTTPFNTSSDGSPLLYDGTESGSTKTSGAKWTGSTSKFPYTSASRYAYQPIRVSPTTVDRTVKYILEFEYSIKDDAATDPDGGRRVVAEILDGHFTDGNEARNSTPLATHVGTEVKGKGSFTTVKLEFTTNASGEVAIWIYAYTPVDAYVDNVKVYPKP